MRWILSLLVALLVGGVISAQQDGYHIALVRIQEAQATNATELDLSNLQLTQIPPEIGNLVNLQRLMLNWNEITTLPPQIGNLVNLQQLELHGTEITTLPPQIGNLANLSHLSVGDTLTSLPPEIGNLANLSSLSVNGTLTSLPPEIGNLVNLQYLYLYSAYPISFPPEFTNLGNLCWLETDYEDFQSNIEKIAQLPKLGSVCNNQASLRVRSITHSLPDNVPPELIVANIQSLIRYLSNPDLWYFPRLLGMIISVIIIVSVASVGLVKLGGKKFIASRTGLLTPAIIYSLLGWFYAFQGLAFLGLGGLFIGLPIVLVIYIIWHNVKYQWFGWITLLSILLIAGTMFIIALSTLCLAYSEHIWIALTPFTMRYSSCQFFLSAG